MDEDKSWHITVDTRRCIGSSLCAGMAPGHFKVIDGHSRPTDETVTPDDTVRDAADMCPVEAITVHDTGTGRQVAPLG